MAHKHSVYDTDNHFSINPITRAISDISNSKTLLMQYDHNSERFTFEMPRHIEGHDMMECTDVHIHYLNVSSNRQDQSSGVYAVDDLQISPSDENMVICSWLISQNATRLVGTLNFLLRFVCRTDDEVDYVWNTAIYSGIKVADGIYNGNDIDDDYSYAAKELEERVAALEAENHIPAPDIAKVGQFLAVKTVDGEGKPVTWEAKNVQVDGSSIELDTTLKVAGKAADAKAVGDALNQVQGGGSVTLDTTLTEEGMAADAKAVGDALARVSGITIVEPAEDDIPNVFLTGDAFSNMTNAKNEVEMELEYISKTKRFTAGIKIKFQGASSLSHPKKNFTIKMYEDSTLENKLKVGFKDWGFKANKYVLKANYIDHSHARNIVSARLWDEIVKSRANYANLPEEMRTSPMSGAIDGFPIKLYVNGTYQGIYTWNFGKDEWMWNMDEDNTNHALLCCCYNDNGVLLNKAGNFRALWSGVNEDNWEIEVGTTGTALTASLNALISCVKDTDDETFKETIGNYLDIESALDYYLYFWANAGLDSLENNLLLATYDGVKWYCGGYDMDAVWGLYFNGSKFIATNFVCPNQYQGPYSLLWERIVKLFAPELKARYAELRSGVLSFSNIVTHFERFMDVIGSDLYAEDLTVYSGIPSGSTNNIKQIRNYVRDRLAYVDGEVAALVETGGDTGETEVTLMTISAAYTGGSVPVGTAVTALTGVTVFANYSDFTTAIVTGYRLSGSIAEGTNIITVTYSGKTTTFTVVGVAESSGDDDTEVTLTGISATYSGGSVPVGTSVTALTGVTVNATYSDGSTGNVTGYTLSGTINEGSNTIIVSYGGKTTTFTVIGETVEVPCTGISLSAETLTFIGAGTKTLTATVNPTDTTDTISWTSTDSSVASVSDGVVTAKANGNVIITVTCGNYSANCEVSVSGIVTAVTDGLALWFKGADFTNDGYPTVIPCAEESGIDEIIADGFMYTTESGSDGEGNVVTTGSEILHKGVNLDAITFADGFTFMAKFALTEVPQSKKYFMNVAPASGGTQFAIIYGYVDNTFEMYTDIAAIKAIREGSQMVVNDTDMHTIVYTFDGEKLVGYLDGNEVVNVVKTITMFGTPLSVRILNSNARQTEGIHAKLRHYMIYNRALTAEEVAQNIAALT